VAPQLGARAGVPRRNPTHLRGGQPVPGGRLVQLGDEHRLVRRRDRRDKGEQKRRERCWKS
jgi:hypothetical protein